MGGNFLMRIIKKRYIILIILGVGLGFYFSYRLSLAPKKTAQTWVVPNIQDMSNKFITEETLINQIHEKQQLITMEVDMTEKVTIDDSWGSLSIFKKVQDINYFGTGTFVVDLSSLNNKNITIDNSSHKIYVKVPAPSIKSITIQEEKTEYQTPETGLLRFGEIELSLEDNQALLKNAKEKMTKKLSEEEYIKEASKNSKETLEALVKGIVETAVKDNYDVSIDFET